MMEKDQDTARIIPSAILPKPIEDVPLYEGISRTICDPSSFTLTLYKFYIDIGLNPHKTVLYSSLDNNAYFSFNDEDVGANSQEVLSISDRVFKKDSANPTESKRFSDLYCELVTRLEDELYKFEALNNDDEIEALVSKAEVLENELKDDEMTDIARKIKQKTYDKIVKQIDKLQDSYVASLLKNANEVCQMVQCAKDVSCSNYDQERLDNYTMEVKYRISEAIYKEPKVSFEINIEDLHSFTASESYKDLIIKVKKGEIKPEELAQHLNYFQSYDTYQLFGKNTKIEGKTIVAFGQIFKVPITFGAWFDPNIYQITTPNEKRLEGDYLVYTKYCRIPKKVIIGVNPAIISCHSEKTSEVPEGFNDVSEVSSCRVLANNAGDSVVILGYELDSSLCDSPLIGSFENHNYLKGEL